MDRIERIKQKKKELGLTFEQLATLSSVPIRTLENMCHGITKHPRIDTIALVERALGLDEKEKSPPTELSEGEERWMQLYYALTDDNKELLIKLIATFKDMPADRRRFVLDAIKMATHK